MVANDESLRVSPFVCYDLRFADEFWARADLTDIYVVPANWPEPRREHWRTLLRARAIENQAYVVGVNRVGTVKNDRYVGDSAIVDPAGLVLVEASMAETVLVAEVTAERVADRPKALSVPGRSAYVIRPRLTHRFRVATVVSGPEDEVLARLASLPSTTRVRTVSTTAGVVVTLAQERRGPLARRRRTLRSLLRQLDVVAARDRTHRRQPG